MKTKGILTLSKLQAKLLVMLCFIALLFGMLPLYKFAQWFQQTILGIEWIIVIPSLRISCIILGELILCGIIYSIKHGLASNSWHWSWKDTCVAFLYVFVFFIMQCLYYIAIID